MRDWIGQELGIGDKVYKGTSGGSSVYFDIGEIVSHKPGSSRLSLEKLIHPGGGNIRCPSTNDPEHRINVSYPEFWEDHSYNVKYGRKTVSVMIHTVMKLSDDQYKEVAERAKIAKELSQMAQAGRLPVTKGSEFQDLLHKAWAKAGL